MKRLALWSLQIGLTIAVTWFIFDRVGVDVSQLRNLDRSVWQPDLIPLTISCLILAGGYGLSAALWGRIVWDLGGSALPLLTSVRVFLIANLGRYIPGKVWQIAGLAYLAKAEGIPVTVATGAAILGQGVSLTAATLIGIGTLFGMNELWWTLTWPSSMVAFGLALAIIGVVSTPWSFHGIVKTWFRLMRSELPEKLGQHRNLGFRWLVLYVLNWGIYCTAFWLLYLSFGEGGTFMQLGPAFAASYVAGYLAIFAPAGAGIREGVLLILLQPVMATETALVFAIITRLWTTTTELIPVLVLVVRQRIILA